MFAKIRTSGMKGPKRSERGPEECEGFRRYADYRKPQEETGKWTEDEGRFGNG
jgi:hypothetical protein